MTDKTEAQPEALRLADERPCSIDDDLYAWSQSAEQMIRDQNAEIQQLKAQLSARQAAPDWIEDLAQSWDECMYDAPGEMIDIGASIRKAASRAAPPQPEREPRTDEWHHNSRVESAAGIRDALSRMGVHLTITTILQLVDITRKAHEIGATNER